MITLEEQRVMGIINPDFAEFIKNGQPTPTPWRKGFPVKQCRQFLRFVREQEATLRPHPSKNPWIEVDGEIIVRDWDVAPETNTRNGGDSGRTGRPRINSNGGLGGAGIGGEILAKMEPVITLDGNGVPREHANGVSDCNAYNNGNGIYGDYSNNNHDGGGGHQQGQKDQGEQQGQAGEQEPTQMVTLPIRVHKPRKIPKGGCPGMVVFANGGYVLRDFEMAAPLCHKFTKLGGIAIDIGYRVAPEHKFPVPARDCYEGLKWVANNYQDLGIDPTKGFLIGGSSCGADFALTCAHLYTQERLSPPLTGIYACMPWGVSDETVPEHLKDRFFSKEQCKNAPGTLDLEALEYGTDHYNPPPTSPLAYPVAFPSHALLPKTYFQVCGVDPTRDCGLILEKVLRDDGVVTKMDIYPGYTHAFWVYYWREAFAQEAREDGVAGLRWLLKKGGGGRQHQGGKVGIGE